MAFDTEVVGNAVLVCLTCGWISGFDTPGHDNCDERPIECHVVADNVIQTKNLLSESGLNKLRSILSKYDVYNGRTVYKPIDKTEVRTTSATGGQKGVKLARFDLIPIGPLTALAEHYGRGAQKYADHQWRKGIDFSKLYAALQRHLTAWWAGIELDTCPPSGEGCAFVTNEGEPFEGVSGVSCYNHTGSHHLDAVMWMAFALRDGVDNHPDLDDRYKPKSSLAEQDRDNVLEGYKKALDQMRSR